MKRYLAAVLLAAIIGGALAGCAQQADKPEALESAEESIAAKTQQTQESIDSRIDRAQKAVGALAAAVGGLEARVDGLQAKSDLEQIQRQLNDALQESGEKRIEALNSASEAFGTVIAKIDDAASQLPDGGAVQQELMKLSAKLKEIQQEVIKAASASQGSAAE